MFVLKGLATGWGDNMHKTVISLFAFAVAAGNALAEPPPDELVQKLTKVIRTHCPEAKIEVTKQEFIAKFETMMFTLHRRNKAGEVFPDTYQEEGPNWKGFMLRITLHDGKYQGAAVVPQTLQQPYFSTYIDASAAEQKDKHYFVAFSYGSRLDENLKKAIFEAIPKTDFKRSTAPEPGRKQ
jgi:hypothetical protein